jgi:hypothetical protein
MSLAKRALNQAQYLSNEASGFIEAAFRHVGKQTWYGTSNDAKGFPGIIAQMLADTAHQVDATGTAAKSSVFFVRLARETVQFLFGNGETISLRPQWIEETVYDTDNNPYQALTNWLNGQVGLRVANKHSVVRIKNIGTATGKMLTDALMFSAYEKFTTALGAEPTHIFLTPRSREQLRASRTATTTNGQPVPLPTDWNGIPLVATSAISNDESI